MSFLLQLDPGGFVIAFRNSAGFSFAESRERTNAKSTSGELGLAAANQAWCSAANCNCFRLRQRRGALRGRTLLSIPDRLMNWHGGAALVAHRGSDQPARREISATLCCKRRRRPVVGEQRSPLALAPRSFKTLPCLAGVPSLIRRGKFPVIVRRELLIKNSICGVITQGVVP